MAAPVMSRLSRRAASLLLLLALAGMVAADLLAYGAPDHSVVNVDSPVKFRQYFGSENLGFELKEDPIFPDREMGMNHESTLSEFEGTARPNTMGELVKSATGSGPDQHADHCATDAKDWDEGTRVFMLSSNGGKLPEHGGHSVAGPERVENGPSACSKPGQGTWAPETVIPIPVTLGTLTSLASQALEARADTYFQYFTGSTGRDPVESGAQKNHIFTGRPGWGRTNQNITGIPGCQENQKITNFLQRM